MEAARRDVLSPADGSFPIGDPRERYRNLAERAKGAAVLSSLPSAWPPELRARCRKEAADFVREIAMAHRARRNFGNEWQAAFWSAEAGIAAWFLWDDLDEDARNAVAEMVIFQADRFIDVVPKMGYRGDTEAETVAWNSTILTLAVNMMPRHPHNHAWDQAAKRYVYNTLAVPQDATDDTAGDDGKAVRQWIVGANLYKDFALENHNQFHIDYVLTTYRFHMQGAALYWLSGRPLPKAFHHHAREFYEKVLLHCMTADGFFAYVSDNDWKRFHCWTESCAIHGYLAMLEQHPLAASLERRALQNALSLWRSFPAGFAYDNPYVCGKAWTSRIADAVLMHITCPDPLPQALPPAEADVALQGTSRLETPELLTHYAVSGSYASSCKGRGGVWVAFVAPREDAWMVLPKAGNYEARIGGKPIIQKAVTRWDKGLDWFWVSRRKEATGSAEAFVSLPEGFAVYVQHLAAADVPAGSSVENSIAVEKPHIPVTAYYSGGRAAWQPGEDHWKRSDERPEPAVPGKWLNLQDRIGLAVCSAGSETPAEIRLPKAGARDAIRLHTLAATGVEQNLWLVVWPDQKHEDAGAQSDKLNASLQRDALVLQIGELVVAFNPSDKPSLLPPRPGGAASQPAELGPGSVGIWRSSRADP